jgi:predicted metal-binding membrane protein
VASVIGGCLDAVVLPIVLVSTLPFTDWAYHANPLQGLWDSFAMLSALVAGASAGLFIWPIAAQVCLWRIRQPPGGLAGRWGFRGGNHPSQLSGVAPFAA